MKTPTEFLIRVQRLLDMFGPADAPLDPIARDILLHISARSDAGEQLRLSDIRFNARFGSPATALKRLQRLIDGGWVETADDPRDGRAQIIALTPIASRKIGQLSAQLRALADKTP